MARYSLIPNHSHCGLPMRDSLITVAVMDGMAEGGWFGGDELDLYSRKSSGSDDLLNTMGCFCSVVLGITSIRGDSWLLHWSYKTNVACFWTTHLVDISIVRDGWDVTNYGCFCKHSELAFTLFSYWGCLFKRRRPLIDQTFGIELNPLLSLLH